MNDENPLNPVNISLHAQKKYLYKSCRRLYKKCLNNHGRMKAQKVCSNVWNFK